MSLSGRTALVTGSSRGIGRAIAIRLAREGADLVVNYFSRKEEAAEVLSIIKNVGQKAIACQADVASHDHVQAMVREAEDKLGPVDILVNNATVHKGRKVHQMPPSDWDIVIKSALYGAFNCCQAVVPGMLQKGWGRIINISSPVGERGYPGDCAYSAAKAGLLGFTKSLARELAPDGITVNAVMPGFVMTEMTRALSPKSIESMKQSIPLGRLCEAEDVAELVAFLASKGDYVTGSIHHVDGGIGM